MYVLLSGIMHHSGGYSELTRNLAVAFNDLGKLAGLQVLDEKNFQDMPLSNYCSAEFLELEERIKNTPATTYGPKPEVFIQVTPPFMFKDSPIPGLPLVGVTMFETRVPDEWYERVNKMDYLVLHDDFQKDLFKVGTTTPKMLSWTPWVTNPMNTAMPMADELPPFILTVGVARVHKNQSKLIEAYRRIKKDFPGMLLVIKAIIEDVEFDDYREDILNDPDIRVIPHNYSAMAMDNLYQNCSVYVSASMCEGLDMPAIKAAMCGKPIVAGYHTGHLSWIPEGHPDLGGVAVDMSTMPNIHPRYREPDMPGYNCLLEDLIQHLRAALTPSTADSYKINTSGLFTREASVESLDKLLKSIV